MADRDLTRAGGWSFHPRQPVAEPLDYVVQVGVAAGASPVMLHLGFTEDGLYVLAVVRVPPGRGPFPAVICLHGGSGGLGIVFMVDRVLNYGMVFDRLLAEGYAVCYTEGRMEIEETYGTDIPAVLDHRDVIATFRHVQRHPEVDPHRVAFFGVSHGGELRRKVISDRGGAPSTALGAGPAALVPGEPAVIEHLGLRYDGPRTERACRSTRRSPTRRWTSSGPWSGSSGPRRICPSWCSGGTLITSRASSGNSTSCCAGPAGTPSGRAGTTRSTPTTGGRAGTTAAAHRTRCSASRWSASWRS